MEARGLAPYNLIQPTISLEMPVPVFRLLTDFVCLLTYEFSFSLWKIAQCTVILFLPLFTASDYPVDIFKIFWVICTLPVFCEICKVYINWLHSVKTYYLFLLPINFYCVVMFTHILTYWACANVNGRVIESSWKK